MLNHSLCQWCSGAVLGLALIVVVAEAAPPGQMLEREVRGDLPVVVNGEARATIVAADEAVVRPLADELAAFLREATGASVPVVADTSVVTEDGRTVKPEYRGRHLILVGNSLNNRAIFPLYCRWLDASDAAYPGDDGYELRTVVNPYGTGCQELILGASTPAGARASLEAIKVRIRGALQGRDLTLPPMLDVKVGPRLQPTFDQAMAEVRANPQRTIGAVLTNSDLANFSFDALKYAWTGETAFAQRAAGVLRQMNQRFDGSYYHGDVRTCDDYALEYAVRGWLGLQHAGVLTADELWETERHLYRDFPFSAHGPGNVGSRHLASGSMAFFLAVDGLLTYGNPDAEARRQLETWREGVRAYFHGACRTYRGDVDQAQDYGAMENVFRYAIHDGYWEYFTSGWADRTVTQMLMNVDNGGYYSGLGGYGEAMPGSLNYGVAIGVCLPITAFVEHRGDLRWIRENVPNLSGSHLGFQVLGVHAFDLGGTVPAQPPRGELSGLTVLPLSEYHHQLGQTSITEGVGPVTTPLERCVDKVMLREGFGQADQYLLLNGFQNTVMGCLDANAIVRFCDQGEVCLFQSTQEEGHDTKNAVWVSNGRNDDPEEGCVERGPMADLGEVCFSATTLPRYHGTDWERNLFWRRGGVVVVMDRLTVKQPGPYVMACTWRSPRHARLTDQGSWEARTEKGVFTVRSSEAPRRPAPYSVAEGRDGETSIAVSPGLRLTSSLGDDRFSAEAPWVLREWKRPVAPAGKVGEVVDFQNVFYLSTEARQWDYHLLRLTDTAALLVGSRTVEGRSLADKALLARRHLKLDSDLEVESDFAWLDTEGLYLAGLRRLAVGDEFRLASSAPVDVVLRREGASLAARIQGASETEMTVSLPGLKVAKLDGAPIAVSGNALRLKLPSGTHALLWEANADGVFAAIGRALELAVSRASQARPPSPTAGRAPQPKAPFRSVWTYDGLRSPGRTVRNLTITSRVDGGASQPGPYAILSDTFTAPGATWQAGKVELTLHLPEQANVVGLRCREYVGAVDLDKTKPDPLRLAEVAVSGDDFGKDIRLIKQPTARSYHYLRGYYGSQFYSEVIDSVTGFREPARSIRLTIERPPGAATVRLGRLQVLVEGPGDTTPLKAEAIRWGKDNRLHWAVWDPDAGRLSVLDAADGRLVWTKGLSAAITGLAWGDVNDDGANELVVTAADWRVRLFDQAGNERLIKDWRGVYEQTGGKYYYGGMPHGVGIYERAGRGAKDLAIGHYYFLSTLTLDGQITKTYEGYACYWQDFAHLGLDVDGDRHGELLAYTETPWQTRVPVVVIGSAKHEPLSSFPAGNGGARLFQLFNIDGETCALIGSHKGCGIYSFTKNAYKWYLPGEVFKSSFFVTVSDDEGVTGMLIGQRDGFLLVVDVDGKIVRQIDVGDEVLGVGALAGMLAASTKAGTRCYDATGRPIGFSPLVTQRFEPALHGNGSALLALHADGRVELLAAD